jgi:hypothetical protein
MPGRDDIVCWLHFGDLHITEADGQNYRDLRALIETANRHLAGRIDFALLPGDNADDAAPEQFRRVHQAIDGLTIPLHIIPGDHDFHTRSLADYHAVLGAPPLPYSASLNGHRCLFLDLVSAGSGGPDFRLDDAQLAWTESELNAADAAGERAIVFMHTYPDDLRANGPQLRALLASHRVACVDMGHTHYNELANDGRTVFMATRSTGQIEEGPVGFSVAAVDGGVVSWRFQPLEASWPLVLITSPADHRLVTDAGSPDQILRGPLRVRAKIWGAQGIRTAVASIDDGAPFPLGLGQEALWHATHDGHGLADGLHRLTITATDADGGTGTETITFRVSRDGAYDAPARHADGSDRDSLGAWPEKHLFGTQLGPNRNGRKW